MDRGRRQRMGGGQEAEDELGARDRGRVGSEGRRWVGSRRQRIGGGQEAEDEWGTVGIGWVGGRRQMMGFVGEGAVGRG